MNRVGNTAIAIAGLTLLGGLSLGVSHYHELNYKADLFNRFRASSYIKQSNQMTFVGGAALGVVLGFCYHKHLSRDPNKVTRQFTKEESKLVDSILEDLS